MKPQTRIKIAEILIKNNIFNRIQLQELSDVWENTIISAESLALVAFTTPKQVIPGSAQEQNYNNLIQNLLSSKQIDPRMLNKESHFNKICECLMTEDSQTFAQVNRWYTNWTYENKTYRRFIEQHMQLIEDNDDNYGLRNWINEMILKGQPDFVRVV